MATTSKAEDGDKRELQRGRGSSGHSAQCWGTTRRQEENREQGGESHPDGTENTQVSILVLRTILFSSGTK